MSGSTALPRLELRHLQAELFATGGQQCKLFIKIRHTRSRGVGLRRERVALRILRGLAVPRLVTGGLPAARLAFDRCVLPRHSCLVQTYEGQPYHSHGGRRTSAATHLGVWLFVLEQFVAFHRHELLYTDIKCSNIVVSKAPEWRVTIVDFDRVLPLGRRTPWHSFGTTLGFEPPEFRTGKIASEASAVYQCALLLVHFLTGSDNRHLGAPHGHLRHAAETLKQVACPDFAELIMRSVRAQPSRRPQTYEALFERASRLRISAAARRTWRHLRSFSAGRLAKLGLDSVRVTDT